MARTVPHAGLCAIVLAGGRSTRFGSDKASAMLQGRTLLDHVTAAASEVAGHVVIAKAAGQTLPPLPPAREIDVVEDADDAIGPLGGILAGLRATTLHFCLVCSCDAPLLQPALVSALYDRIRGSLSPAVVPVVDDRLQPLFAIYRRAGALAVFNAARESGERSTTRLIERLALDRVSENEIREFDPDLDSFRNCNAPADLAVLEALLALRERSPS